MVCRMGRKAAAPSGKRKLPRALAVEIEREKDGRWIAEIPVLPGVLAYGATRKDALARAEALALRVMAERLENGVPAKSVSVA